MDRNSEPTDEFDSGNDEQVGRALKYSLVCFLALGILGLAYVTISRDKPTVAPESQPVSLPEVRSSAPAKVPSIKFTDITEKAGLDFVHINGATGEKLLPETMGGGCAFFDFDGDGDQDILLVNARPWPWSPDAESTAQPTLALYENDGHGSFSNVTTKLGIDFSGYGMGVATGDYDTDGDADIFVSCVGYNCLLRNDGVEFTNVTDAAGIAGDENAWSTSCGWFDYDKDGDLDLFVCNYVDWNRENDLQQGFQLDGIGKAYGPPTAFQGSFCYLYKNQGNGQFEDASESSGIQVVNDSSDKPLGKSLGVTFIDADLDGWLDIVVANDTVQNFCFRNDQQGGFVESGIELGIAFDAAGKARGGMGIDSAEFIDGSIGIAVANFANEMTALYVQQGAAAGQATGFIDDAIATGLGPLTRGDLAFGLFFFDADLDGRLDMLSVNGHLEDEINKVQVSQHYRQPPRLFWNAGSAADSQFVAMGEEKTGADFGKPIVGRGATFADIDDDGDLDVLLTQIGGPPRLLRNDQDSDNHFLRLNLVDPTGNHSAIGATVAIEIENKTIRRTVMPTRSYLSQVELPVVIGLGTAIAIDKATVQWTDGTVQDISDVKLDATKTVTRKRPDR